MKIDTVHTEYLTPSRTIETIEIETTGLFKRVYVYNYEGYSFRLFESAEAIKDFFTKGKEPELHFPSEEALEDYLRFMKYYLSSGFINSIRSIFNSPQGYSFSAILDKVHGCLCTIGW